MGLSDGALFLGEVLWKTVSNMSFLSFYQEWRCCVIFSGTCSPLGMEQIVSKQAEDSAPVSRKNIAL